VLALDCGSRLRQDHSVGRAADHGSRKKRTNSAGSPAGRLARRTHEMAQFCDQVISLFTGREKLKKPRNFNLYHQLTMLRQLDEELSSVSRGFPRVTHLGCPGDTAMLGDKTADKNQAAKKAARLEQGQVVQQNNDQSAPRKPSAPSTVQSTIVLSPPTQDQEDYLRSIERSSDDYDPNVVIGGPRQLRG
jgi:hypothetical protein